MSTPLPIEEILAGTGPPANLDEIGRRENFFALGGNSMLITRVAVALRKELGRHIEVVELFENRTVETLAQHLSQPAVEHRDLDGVLARGNRQRESRGRRHRLGRKPYDQRTPTPEERPAGGEDVDR